MLVQGKHLPPGAEADLCVHALLNIVLCEESM